MIREFPLPEILSIETNIDYYDKKDGFFNKFEANDLTDLNNQAKQHIENKVPESGLFEVAEQEVLDFLLLIENSVQTIGWTLDYSVFKIGNDSRKISKK